MVKTTGLLFLLGISLLLHPINFNFTPGPITKLRELILRYILNFTSTNLFIFLGSKLF